MMTLRHKVMLDNVDVIVLRLVSIGGIGYG
jgi:hypothetical protein